MGLTVHYTLSTREPLEAPAVRELVNSARAFALDAPVDAVSGLIDVGSDFPLAHEFIKAPGSRGDGAAYMDVPPEAGFVFNVTLGKGSEGALFGLCRYPATVKHRGRAVPTGIGTGWRLSGFCKTQYASMHGWDHFLRCHRALIDLVASWPALGVDIDISDEGGYWPERSETTLRARVNEMNGMVAALGGALKDALGGETIEGPIFQHRDFENLEADGIKRYGDKMRGAVDEIRKAAEPE